METVDVQLGQGIQLNDQILGLVQLLLGLVQVILQFNAVLPEALLVLGR